MSDRFDLERFTDAQDAGYAYARALAELRAGCKRTHWMWFVFPQLAGLGESAMAQRYAISGPEEARAYLAHPVLGARLVSCVTTVNALEGRTAHEIFGSPDDLKFRSCVTLFGRVSDDPDVFRVALGRYYGGAEDPATLRLLARA